MLDIFLCRYNITVRLLKLCWYNIIRFCFLDWFRNILEHEYKRLWHFLLYWLMLYCYSVKMKNFLNKDVSISSSLPRFLFWQLILFDSFQEMFFSPAAWTTLRALITALESDRREERKRSVHFVRNTLYKLHNKELKIKL